jgi:HigB_toxin, RelE-like toxic component of a toxin-antitoxin system
VVFNIEGNNFRLVVAVAYVRGAMYIKFIGTHEEYDHINVATVEPQAMSKTRYLIRPIRNQADYEAALALVRIGVLGGGVLGSGRGQDHQSQPPVQEREPL